MAKTKSLIVPEAPTIKEFGRDLARALAGAVLFGLPMLMTQEMWSLGFTVPPYRLALLLVLAVPLLTALSYYCGFRESTGWYDALIDGLVAFLIGACAAALALAAFGVLGLDSSPRQAVGTVALLAVPCGFGAALARSQLDAQGEDDDDSDRWQESYAGELFLMVAGALFFAFNIAPTEEIGDIVRQQGHLLYAVGLVAVSLLTLHAFVYALDFKGQHRDRPLNARLPDFVSLTLPGYALVLLASLLALWIFGRLDGLTFDQALHHAVVLGFPGALGAAAARLVI